MIMSQIAENLAAVRARIVSAAQSSGRDAGSVRLLAVSKTFPATAIAEAYAAGQRSFGENRIQEIEAKAPALPSGIEWHLIGHLQANKVRSAVKWTTWIHSVDSLDLLNRIDRIAGEEGRRPNVLLEVNISGEKSKFGFSPKDAGDIAPLAAAMPNLRMAGLMTMAPMEASPEVLHQVFGGLRQLRDRIAGEYRIDLPVLSMGMSGDFEIAIAEGATIVRIGTAIFGHR